VKLVFAEKKTVSLRLLLKGEDESSPRGRWEETLHFAAAGKKGRHVFLRWKEGFLYSPKERKSGCLLRPPSDIQTEKEKRGVSKDQNPSGLGARREEERRHRRDASHVGRRGEEKKSVCDDVAGKRKRTRRHFAKIHPLSL